MQRRAFCSTPYSDSPPCYIANVYGLNHIRTDRPFDFCVTVVGSFVLRERRDRVSGREHYVRTEIRVSPQTDVDPVSDAADREIRQGMLGKPVDVNPVLRRYG